MRSRSLWGLLLAGSCGAASFGSLPQARADVFQCEHQGTGPEPALVCKDSGIQSGSGSARVTLRKMPAWGTHAGLTIIDVCLDEVAPDNKAQADAFFVVEPSPVQGLSEPTTHNCKRRYCTDKKRAFLFMINSIPVPIGWSVVSFRLGKKSQSFSISCDELRQSDLELEGEGP